MTGAGRNLYCSLMVLTLLLLFASSPAQALKFLPHYTVDISCVGEGHRITMRGDFSESAFIESAVVDGVEEGPDFGSYSEGDALVYSKPGVFSIAIPADNPRVRRFLSEAEIRGQTVKMTCDIDWTFNLLK